MKAKIKQVMVYGKFKDGWLVVAKGAYMTKKDAISAKRKVSKVM